MLHYFFSLLTVVDRLAQTAPIFRLLLIFFCTGCLPLSQLAGGGEHVVIFREDLRSSTKWRAVENTEDTLRFCLFCRQKPTNGGADSRNCSIKKYS